MDKKLVPHGCYSKIYYFAENQNFRTTPPELELKPTMHQTVFSVSDSFQNNVCPSEQFFKIYNQLQTRTIRNPVSGFVN